MESSSSDTTLLTSEMDTTCPTFLSTTTTEADSPVEAAVLPEQVFIDNEIDITLQELHLPESLHESAQETDAQPTTFGKRRND